MTTDEPWTSSDVSSDSSWDSSSGLSSMSTTSSYTDPKTDSTEPAVTEPSDSEALRICLNEYDDLESERDAFLITMIVFILLFLGALGASIYLFTRLT